MSDHLSRLMAAVVREMMARRPYRVPEGGAILLRAFGDLCRVRSSGDAGPNPLPLSEIDAWCRLNRWPLSPRQQAAIRAMDEAFLAHVRAEMARQRRTGPTGKTHLRPFSEAAFDEVFG